MLGNKRVTEEWENGSIGGIGHCDGWSLLLNVEERKEGLNKVFRSRGGFQCGHGKNNRGIYSFAFPVVDYYYKT
jgi:hypothetical protein